MRATTKPGARFRSESRQVLRDRHAQRVLDEATNRLLEGRLAAWETVDDVQSLRDQACEIRRRAISSLDSNLEQFADAVTRVGGTVYFAKTAQEAADRVVDISRAAGATLAAKSKSMLSEEIRLNEALEAAGIRIVETDLGEYILQLAGEPPAHIIVPSIHKTAEDVARLFSEVAKRPVGPDLSELTLTARGLLREVFLEADVGITGVNFAVAETGSICLVTNEGNGRLVSSLPRVHIALMGMERIVPGLADLAVLLQLLGRSATGQTLSAYTTLITGPRRAGEADGPDQLHVVVVDNGRSALRDTEYSEMLHCIRCGACLNVCPVYRKVGGTAYSRVYSGPMGAVLLPLLQGLARAPDLPNASTLCGACADACPVKIPIPDLLLLLRRDLVEQRVTAWPERLAFEIWAAAWSSPLGYRATACAARAALPLARRLAPYLPGLSGRRLPVMPRHSYRDR